jgi:hypothetical protein
MSGQHSATINTQSILKCMIDVIEQARADNKGVSCLNSICRPVRLLWGGVVATLTPQNLQHPIPSLPLLGTVFIISSSRRDYSLLFRVRCQISAGCSARLIPYVQGIIKGSRVLKKVKRVQPNAYSVLRLRP